MLKTIFSIKIILIYLLFSVVIESACFAQVSNGKYTVLYESVKMDSTYSEPIDLTMSTYIEQLRTQMGEKLSVVIGYTEKDLLRFKPQSPLSNFLVDQLYLYGNLYFKNMNIVDSIDLALINFGGIRGSIPAGKITIETMYQIAPFDNYAVILYMKGSELKKMFKKFTEKDNGALSHAQTIFQNGRIISYTVAGLTIEDQKIYKMITLDFLQNGGDGYLEGIQYEKVFTTGVLIRDVYIDRIMQLTNENKKIEGKTDQRVIIKPTP